MSEILLGDVFHRSTGLRKLILWLPLFLGICISGCGTREHTEVRFHPESQTLFIDQTSSHVSFATINRYTLTLQGVGPVYTDDQIVLSSDRFEVERTKGVVEIQAEKVKVNIMIRTKGSDYFDPGINGTHRINVSNTHRGQSKP